MFQKIALHSEKNRILSFVLLTFTFSWLLEFKMIKGGGINDITLDFLLMWTPGIVALFLSLLYFKNLKEIGFKLGSFKYFGWAYLFPAITAVLILAVLILTGQGQFEVSPALVEKSGSLKNALTTIFFKGTTIAVFFGFISGLGEEIGWRGFLHSQLIKSKISHPFVITGIIWSIWHWPLILFSNYATSNLPALSVFFFTVVTISFSVIIGWLREKSGTVYVAALAHGVHNTWIQAIYPAFLKKGPLDEFLGGESGLINAIIYSLLALYIYKKYLNKGIPK